MLPNFTGTWLLKPAESHILSGTPKRMLTRILHGSHELNQFVELTDHDGIVKTQSFTIRLDGEEIVQLSGALRTRAHWNGPELVIESFLTTAEREVYFKDHWTLSADGAILTMIHRGDSLDGQIAVRERSGSEQPDPGIA